MFSVEQGLTIVPKPFPERVATDELRRSFLAYGVSGTPTFVLVDGENSSGS